MGVAAKILRGQERDVWQRGDTVHRHPRGAGTPRVYVPAAADLGKWLKALASYENGVTAEPWRCWWANQNTRVSLGS